MDWETVTKELQKKLDPKHVKNSPQIYGDFIEGWHAIAEANRIFGFENWSYEINSLVMAGQPVKNEKGNHIVTYMCQIKLIVGGAVREDVGFGSGASKNIGDAHESAGKEAVTDALKRALRTFGNPFGLALYDKTKANVGIDVIPMNQQKKIWEQLKEESGNELLDAKSLDDCRTIYDTYQNKLKEHDMFVMDWKDVLTAHFKPFIQEFEKSEQPQQEAAEQYVKR